MCNYKTIFGPKYYISYFIQKLVIFLIRYFFVTPPLCSRVFLAWPLNQLPIVKLLLIIILTFHTWKVYLAMALSWHFHICLCYLWNQHFSGWVKCINLQLLQRENLPHQNSLDGKYVRFAINHTYSWQGHHLWMSSLQGLAIKDFFFHKITSTFILNAGFILISNMLDSKLRRNTESETTTSCYDSFALAQPKLEQSLQSFNPMLMSRLLSCPHMGLQLTNTSCDLTDMSNIQLFPIQATPQNLQ